MPSDVLVDELHLRPRTRGLGHLRSLSLVLGMCPLVEAAEVLQVPVEALQMIFRKVGVFEVVSRGS